MSFGNVSRVLFRSGLMALFALLVVASGCRPRGANAPFDPNAPEAAAARLEAYLAKHPDDKDAWRDLGHIYWLYLGRSDDAIAVFDRLAKDGDAVARMSRMLMAESRLDIATTQRHAYALVEQAATTKRRRPVAGRHRRGRGATHCP